MNYEEILSPVILEADSLIKKVFYELAPLYKEDFPAGQDVTVPLFTVLHSTSESVLILLLNSAIFEADVLLRTLMEGTVKYCYLMNGNDEEREQRYNEYKKDLTQIDSLNDHKKALDAVEILKEFSNNSTKPFELSILDEKTVEKLESDYPKTKRNQLKQKWSYGNILRTLAKQNVAYEAQLASLSSYALMSHFCHFDWTGVSTRNLQIATAAKGNEIPDVGHGLRILSNVMTFYLFRVSEYINCNSYSTTSLLKIVKDMYQFILRIDKQQNKLVESKLL